MNRNRVQIKFGTDGWRAIIAQDFTFANVRICAQSIAEYLNDAGLASRGLVVGYDTRFASEHFAATVAEVMAGNGIKTYICQQPSPTPVISYAILTTKAAGAVIITASHNPAIWNGLKYKPEYAGSASPEVIAAIEKHIPDIVTSGEIRAVSMEEGLNKGLIEYLDPFPAYFSQIASIVDLEAIKRAGLKVVVDSMYGAGSGYFKKLLADGNTEIIEINAERNPSFPGIQPEPIAHNLKKLSLSIKENGAHIGLATDGDADRIGIMDEHGVFVTQLVVFALLTLYLLEVRGKRGAIVKTITTTNMAYRLGEIYKVPVYETPVGFKYVGPLMIKEKALIGGEESGGFGFEGHIPERDGILAALYFLHMMIKLKKTPSELVTYLYSLVGPYYYDRVDIEFPEKEREAITSRVANNKFDQIAGLQITGIDSYDGYRFRLVDDSWLLIRFSGTEPILRIYAETSSPEGVRKLLQEGKRLAGV